MAEAKEKPFIVDAFVKDNEKLKTSELSKFYETLDGYLRNNKTESAHCTNIITDPQLRSLCNEIEKIFNEWDKICKFSGDEKHKCYNYLNYWLYGKILEYNSYPLNIFYFYQGLKNIFNAKLNGVPAGTYEKYFEQVTYKETIKNKKELHDFTHYYDDIINVINDKTTGNKEKNCQYLLHILDLYSNIKDEYSPELSKRYDKESKLFQAKFNNESNLNSLLGKCAIYYESTESENIEDIKNRLLKKNGETALPVHVKIPEGLNLNFSAFLFDIQENILSELPSHDIYKDLNKDETSHNYDSYCSEVSTSNADLKKLCKKLARNLKNITENTKMGKLSHGDRCLLFIFWAYEEISKIFNTSWRNVHSIPEAQKLLEAWRDISKETMRKGVNEREVSTRLQIQSNCTRRDTKGSCIRHRYINELGDNYALNNYKTCLYYIDCTYNECKEMKSLFDYFSNFKDIQKKISSKDTCPKYSTYLKYIMELYNKYRYFDNDDCCKWKDCGDYFNCSEDVNPNKLMESLPCHFDKNNPEKPSHEDNQEAYKDHDFSWENIDWEDLNFSDNEDPYQYEDYLPEFKYDDDMYSKYENEPKDRVAKDKRRLLKFSFNKNKMKYMFLVAGISYLAFALFRYTPLGNWLIDRNLKKHPMNDFYNYTDTEESSLYDSWDYDAYNRILNFGYYPSEESSYY
ncbi:variable surface protein [Plasmodium gonderi]|uniref:Variable surface protein n=1 Tax=Plasmodium gonderi TaxID=77519 RepID=A0A1Y1JGH0_PLAGO|nr:variable surface protein [Plasmodium gonderi]GAW80435.1 variable surface protein [Plasmodium gonderi]